MSDTLAQFQTRLGYHFSDAMLLRAALTHRSQALIDEKDRPFHNQRLEFLGDAVLGTIIAEAMYEAFPDDAEGVLSRKLVALVNGETLAAVAKALGVGDVLDVSDSEEKHGGRELQSNLEDACEALIGAIYLDGGLDAARSFVMHHWHAHIAALAHLRKDPKTELQEVVQGEGWPLPHYEVVATEGPSHAPIFTIRVHVQGQESVDATGANKKQAEREAAARMLAQLERTLKKFA